MLILWNAAWDIDAHLLHILASFCVVYACDRHRMGWTNWIHSNLTKEQGCLDITKKNSKNCRDIVLYIYWYILIVVDGVAHITKLKNIFFLDVNINISALWLPLSYINRCIPEMRCMRIVVTYRMAVRWWPETVWETCLFKVLASTCKDLKTNFLFTTEHPSFSFISYSGSLASSSEMDIIFCVKSWFRLNSG